MRKVVGIVGLGYVGLSLAMAFIKDAYGVICYDIDKEKVERLKGGIPPFYEPNVDKRLRWGLKTERLVFVDEPPRENIDAVFICVGTPSKADGSIDLKYVEKAVSNYRGVDFPVIIKSTVLPGTTARLGKKYNIRHIAMIPEFLSQGNAIEMLKNPEKVVVGADDTTTLNKVVRILQNIYLPKGTRVIKTSTVNAEIIKYAQNTMLASRLSIINTFAQIANMFPNGDIKVVEEALGLDSRIGPKFLKSGFGYGGSCFPKDVSAISRLAPSKHMRTLLNSIGEANKENIRLSVEDALRFYRDWHEIAVLGLAFKPNTDDMRNAPSIQVIDELVKRGVPPHKIRAHDPLAIENARKIIEHKINYYDNLYSCLKGADLAIIVTDWDEYKNLTPEILRGIMRAPNVYDGRRILDPKIFITGGVNYNGVGWNASRNYVEN